MCQKEPVITAYRRKRRVEEVDEIEDETEIKQVEEYRSPYISNGSPSRRAWERRIHKGEPAPEEEPEYIPATK